MIRNYITVAIRNLSRNKLYAFINIAGLSIGVACCILIGLFVFYEWSHDRTYSKGDRLFRMVSHEIRPGGERIRSAFQREDLGSTMVESFPEVIGATRIVTSSVLMSTGEKQISEKVLVADPDFLTMFALPMVAGAAGSALERPDQLVITKPLADRFFDGTFTEYRELLGRTIQLGGNRKDDWYTISGVFDDLPRARSLTFDAATRYENREKFGWSNFWDSPTGTYVELDDPGSLTDLEEKLPSFSRNFAEPKRRQFTGSRWADDPNAFILSLQPIGDVHFDHTLSNDYDATSNPQYAWILVCIGSVVLAIACINFTTLALSRSTGRTLEVGIRKVMGAHRGQIARQFWGEALLVGGLGSLGGVALSEMLLPVFNGLVGVELSLLDLSLASVMLGGGGLLVAVGLVAGFYPAVVVSRFHPTEAFQKFGGLPARQRMTASLLVVQYGVAITFLICTGVMVEQLSFLRDFELGYDIEQILVVELDGSDKLVLGERFKTEVSRIPGVRSVALTNRAFGSGVNRNDFMLPDGTVAWVHIFRIDYDFWETLGVRVLEGRGHEKQYKSDPSESVVVNETFVRMFASDKPIGKRIRWANYRSLQNPRIIGVVPDFHFRSLHEEIQPAVFHIAPIGSLYYALVRLDVSHLRETLDGIKIAWEKASPDLPFVQRFYDDHFYRQYREEARWGTIIKYSAVLAAVIACMGLFGQASLMVIRRTKEIGIRKTLGATARQILALLSRDLVRLVAAANVIAWPIAWYAMDRWLSEFAFRVGLSPVLFVIGGLTALMVAVGAVSYLGIRAARGNPVDALRYE